MQLGNRVYEVSEHERRYIRMGQGIVWRELKREMDEEYGQENRPERRTEPVGRTARTVDTDDGRVHRMPVPQKPFADLFAES